MSANVPFTHKAFCSRKADVMHSVSNSVRGVPPFSIFSKSSLSYSLKSVEGFWVKRRSFFPKPSTFLLRFTVFSISLCPHHIHPNVCGWYFPQSLRGWNSCHPTSVRWSLHIPVSPCSGKPPFSHIALLEQGTPTCMRRVSLFSSWHWCVFERLCSLYAVQARLA